MKTYAAFFDIDDTLLRGNSGRILTQQAYKEGLLSNGIVARALVLSLIKKMKLISHKAAINTLGSWLRGMEEKEISAFCNTVTDSYIITNLKKDAIDAIAYHRNNGAVIVLLSASLNYVCDALGSYLDIDHYLSSSMEVENGIFTGRPAGRYCHDREKAVLAREFCDSHGLNIEDAWYYGDSIVDRFILDAVGNPVCVDPDKRLRRLALKKNWAITSW
jgi:HAD superfamily hydrolase (TIGR01490 family)